MGSTRQQFPERDGSPIITFLTDFGLSDSYVSEMKLAVLRHCRHAVLLDVSHSIPRHDILGASIILQRVIASALDETVHIAVVDPGVGTDRRLIATRVHDQWVVCPDNGLITWPARYFGGSFYEINWRPASSSSTFHGRDVLAPIASKIAGGEPIESFARLITDPVLLDVYPVGLGARRGKIIHIDHFGNATTNIPAEAVAHLSIQAVMAGSKNVGPVRRTYCDVAVGQPLALIGSSGLMEIAVRDGSAADLLSLKVWDAVDLL